MHCYLREFKAMGGPCKIRLCAEEFTALDLLDAAENEVRRLEARYSRYLGDSITAQINTAAGTEPVLIDAETRALLDYADTAWRESDGLFDLTSGVLRKAWNFSSGQVPSANALEPLLARVGWQRVQRTEETVYLPEEGMELDFGGCVKEYAADSAVSVLQRAGVSHALVELAGDIATLGDRGDGHAWQVGIRGPEVTKSPVASLALTGQALASSGDYERFIELDGKRYGHILNPLTGWPVHGLAAVSVSAPQCLVAGSAATLAMLRSELDALQWLEDLGLPWVAVNHRGEVMWRL